MLLWFCNITEMPVLCLEYACFIVMSNSWLPMNEILQHCLSLTLGLRIHRGGDRWMSEYWTCMMYPQQLTDCHWGSTIVWIVDAGDESWYNYLSKGSGWHPQLLMHSWVWPELCWYLEVRWYWQEKRKKPVQLPLWPTQIPYWLHWEQTQPSMLSGWWLLAP